MVVSILGGEVAISVTFMVERFPPFGIFPLLFSVRDLSKHTSSIFKRTWSNFHPLFLGYVEAINLSLKKLP